MSIYKEKARLLVRSEEFKKKMEELGVSEDDYGFISMLSVLVFSYGEGDALAGLILTRVSKSVWERVSSILNRKIEGYIDALHEFSKLGIYSLVRKVTG